MAKQALAKTQKAVQNEVQKLPKESGGGLWHVVGGVLAGTLLGFGLHTLTSPKKPIASVTENTAVNPIAPSETLTPADKKATEELSTEPVKTP